MTAGTVKLLAVNLPTTADLFKFEQERFECFTMIRVKVECEIKMINC